MVANHSLLSAFGDPTRSAILDRLRAGPTSVADLARGLPVTRPAVSQHLKVLQDAGLVTASRVGTRRLYAIDPDQLRELRDYFDDFWRSALATFREAAERRPDERRRP